MSLKPQAAYVVPGETARVAQAIYPKGNIYMNLYDTFGTLFKDEDFRDLFSYEGQPALSPVRLAVVCILQFVEGLTDRQAAESVRTRIDWKYLLCLELTDAGFDHTALSEFRTRLVDGSAEQRVFDKLLNHFREHGLLKERGQQRTDSTHVLGAIRAIKRIECVGEAMRHALNTLAVVMPEWTLENAQPDWVDWYGSKIEEYRLPQSKSGREAYIRQVGADGLELLSAVYNSNEWLRKLPSVETMRRIWLQNYTWTQDGQLRWRQSKELPSATDYISSPYDIDVRYNRKRGTSWIGYKVHLTETHDEDAPHLITNVETTAATTADGDMTSPIHESLQDKGMLPSVHTVDTGYVDAELLIDSKKEFGVELVGPVRSGGRHQEEGFKLSNFAIDWEQQEAVCPADRTSSSWSPAVDKNKNKVVKIKFSCSDCGNCRFQTQCTRSNPPRRTLTVRPEAQHKALQDARARRQTEQFTQQYAKRAGIEGTISQGVRRSGMRRSRYIGLPKTHLQHLLTASAINIVRVMNWLDGKTPGQTPQSAFVRLYAAAA
jgi:transposase